MKSKNRLLTASMFNRAVVVNSLKLSLFVGTILNLLNNWNFLFKREFGSISLVKVVLTYFVPFVVSSYSIGKTKMELAVGNESLYDVNLQCTGCGQTTVKVKKDELIPVCNNCKERTRWKQIN